MNHRLTILAAGFTTLLTVFAVGCGDDEASSGGGDGLTATGEGPCDAATDCAGETCVALIDGNNPPVYCSEDCSPGSCPDGMYCDTSTFGLINKTFCRFGSEPSAGEPAPAPAEPPTLPCMSDADCDDGLVCATNNGEVGCAPPCTQESECSFTIGSPLGNYTFDLATCGMDDNGLQVCLPDPACYPNPAVMCIEAPSPI